MISLPQLTVLAGHYGSGKTHLAVNLALYIRRTRERVAVADLDIVNPYYRAKDAWSQLKAAGIELIASPLAGSNLEAPSMGAGAGLIFDDPELYVVADVGGDDRGAVALGRYAAKLETHQSRQVLFVFNGRRPLTACSRDALAVLREIEIAGRFTFTGIVNNSNVGSETTSEAILDTQPIVDELSKLCDLPVVMTSARRDLIPSLEGKIDNLFPIDILKKAEWVL